MFNGYFHYLEPVRYARAVATVPRFPNGDLLLVRLRRAPAVGSSIEFPRGGVEPCEDLDVAVTRELSEETGYTLSREAARHIGRVVPDSATINGLMDVFEVEIPQDAVQGAFDEQEIELPMRVSEAQFLDMVKRGDIVDGITLSSWALAQVVRQG